MVVAVVDHPYMFDFMCLFLLLKNVKCNLRHTAARQQHAKKHLCRAAGSQHPKVPAQAVQRFFGQSALLSSVTVR